MNLPSWSYSVMWFVWAALFGVFEAIALVDDDRGDTLSEHVLALTELHPILWFLAAGFFAWLVRHLLWRK